MDETFHIIKTNQIYNTNMKRIVHLDKKLKTGKPK